MSFKERLTDVAKESLECSRFKLVATNVVKNKNILEYDFRGDFREACHLMTKAILAELGDGDNENGGMGSLKNCYGDIWNWLFLFGYYNYADYEFHVYRTLEVKNFLN